MSLKQEIFQSRFFKVLVGVFIVWGIIVIFRGGYDFGQFLHKWLH